MSHKTMKVNNNGQKQLKGKPCTHGFEGVRGEGQARSEGKEETAHAGERRAGGRDMGARLMGQIRKGGRAS